MKRFTVQEGNGDGRLSNQGRLSAVYAAKKRGTRRKYSVWVKLRRVSNPTQQFRHLTWEESDAEHAAERRRDAEAIASDSKSAWQVQVENSFIPVGAKIEVDFDSFLKRCSAEDACLGEAIG